MAPGPGRGHECATIGSPARFRERLNLMFRLLRPWLFTLPPETAHALTLRALSALGSWPRPSRYSGSAVRVGSLSFPNRVGLAAGFDKNGTAVAGLSRLGFGFLEVGTVTPRPQPGNVRPRVFRLPRSRSLINRMGFPNDGAQVVAARLRARGAGVILGVNIGKNATTPLAQAVDDYVAGFQTFAPLADYIAVNVSSPNTAGLRALQEPGQLEPILAALSAARHAFELGHGRHVPLFVKIAPDLTDDAVGDIAGVVEACGIEGVIATNTTVAREPVAQQPRAGESGGLSGAALFPRSLSMVGRIRAALPRAVIVASGGIDSLAAARAMRAAGADLVQLYTGLVYRGPVLVHEIVRGLAADSDGERTG